MKKLQLLGVLLLIFTILVFGRSSCLAKCDFYGGTQTCTAMNANLFWCDTNAPGSNTNPILKVCDPNTVGWVEIEKTDLSLGTTTTPITLSNDFTVSGTRILDFGANRLRNIATPTATTDAARKDYVDALSGGLAVGASTILDFGANRLRN